MLKALDFALLLIQLFEKPAIILATMIYDLSEAKLSLESDLLSIKDTNLSHLAIITKIHNIYTKDEIVQRIIEAKLGSFQKISYYITKNHFKLELEDYHIINNLLYIKDHLYVLPSKNNILYTRIIKKVYSSLLGLYADRSSTYNRLSYWYYQPKITDIVT